MNFRDDYKANDWGFSWREIEYAWTDIEKLWYSAISRDLQILYTDGRQERLLKSDMRDAIKLLEMIQSDMQKRARKNGSK